MRRLLVWLMLATSASALWGADSAAQTWSFEEDDVGKLPRGWTAAKTGDGEGSVWKVTEDKSAPNGAQVLAQVANGPGPLFNLCIVDGSAAQDFQLSVSFKAVDGKIDQGGGLVWRYVDSSNYYVARFNPLEKNFRLYKVVDGKRMQLATKEGLEGPAGEWHKLVVKIKGDDIQCSLNGTRHLEATDATFAKAGKIGLWTKADAQTYFDGLDVKEIK